MVVMVIGLLLSLSLLEKADIHQTQRCGPVVVEGASWTLNPQDYLQSWVRLKGRVPAGGVWSLKMLSMTAADGKPIEAKGPLNFGRTDDLNSIGGVFASRKPSTVRVKGELVHYRTETATAEFPLVKLEASQFAGSRSSRPDQPAFRNWEVPGPPFAVAKTDLGLLLTYFRLPMGGYAGPGYDDMARFPVRVEPRSLAEAVGVERVDAATDDGQVKTIYQKNPPIDGAVFDYRNKQVQPTMGLTLHVTRMLVDKRYPFTLTLPVQAGKDPFEKMKARPDPKKMVVWPKG